MNAIVKRDFNNDTWAMIERIAPVMQKSRLFGVATAEQAAAIMLKGHELGLPLTTSFEFIQVIMDKPTLSPRGALALIIQSGECEDYKIADETTDKGVPTACSVWMKRKDGREYKVRFTMEDAKRADLIKAGGGWEKYPQQMLKWRAVGFVADVLFPDIIGGMKRSDELGADITPEGNVINATWTPAPTSPQSPRMTMGELLAKYTADQILAVNDGKIPQTLDDVERVNTLLEQQAKKLEFTMEEVKELKP